MSRATRQKLAAVFLIAGLAANATAQQRAASGSAPQRAVGRPSGSHNVGHTDSRGLLRTIFGPVAAHPQPHARPAMPAPTAAVRPVGLLDRLRALTDGVSPDHPQAVAPIPAHPVDWTGVPYHEPHGNTAARTPRPMRDPSGAPIGTGIPSRSGSLNGRTIPGSGAARSSLGAVPTPPSAAEIASLPSSRIATDTETETVQRPPFSETSSSRRSGRRSLDPLDDLARSPSDLQPVAEAPSGPRVAQGGLSDSVTETETAGDAGQRRSAAATPPSLTAADSRGDVRQPPQTQAATRVTTGMASSQTDMAANTGMRLQPENAVAAEGPTALANTADTDAPTVGLSLPEASPAAAAADNWQAGGSASAADAQPHSDAADGDATVGAAIAGATPTTAAGPSLRTAPRPTAAGGDARPSAAASASTTAALHSVTSEVPGVRVIHQGPANIVIRQETPYEIRVENRGSTEAPGVLVRTVLPHWIEIRGHQASRGEVATEQDKNERQLLWQVDTLAAGASERLLLRLAAAQSGTFEVAIDWTLVPQTSVAQIRVQEPKLQLLIEGPDQVVYGESATYKVRVLNPGDGPAPNVSFTLSPNSATPQTQQIGDIPAGKEAQFEVQLAAQDLVDLQIHGLATGDQGLRTEASKSIRVVAARLEAVLSGPPLKYQDSEAIYQLKVINRGAATSRDIAASLRLPAGVRYLGGLDTAEVAGDVLSWKIDQLAPAASREYELRCQMSATGSHLLDFACTGTAAGKAAVSITTQVDALADLVLRIADPPAPAPVGSDVVYEVTIRNRGSKAASDVQAVMHFSNDIEPERIEGHPGEISVGQVLFEPIARIEAGKEIRLRVVARAASAGLHRFRTEVTAGDTVLVAEEATRYLSATTDQISRRSSDSTAR